MRITLHSGEGDAAKTTHGVVELEGDEAVLDAGAKQWLSGMNIMNPDDLSRPVVPSDGRRYIEGLVYSWRGTYCWVELEYDEEDAPPYIEP